MLNTRRLIAALLAFWLVLGPAAGGWASATDGSCESMMMSALPADDCCGGDNAAATSCAGVCATASLGIAFLAVQLPRIERHSGGVGSRYARYASRAAPPDIAPPKSFVS